ncbi:hypothetical protein CDN98_01370 [Roseateles terrae]|nr:hypothetical protein CDN98_01370 [Roseateles terrae]
MAGLKATGWGLDALRSRANFSAHSAWNLRAFSLASRRSVVCSDMRIAQGLEKCSRRSLGARRQNQ